MPQHKTPFAYLRQGASSTGDVHHADFTLQEWFLTFTNSIPRVGRPSVARRYTTEEGQFIHECQELTAKDRLPTAEFDAFVAVLRFHVPDAQLRKTGSRAKGVAIEGSDFDYHIVTREEMTTLERELILQDLRIRGYNVSCNKAFTLKTVGGASIDFFPQKAEWHENVSVQKPGSLTFDQGAQNALKKLKTDFLDFPSVNSHRLEDMVVMIQREHGLKSKEDPSGLIRFLVASAILKSDMVGRPSVARRYTAEEGQFIHECQELTAKDRLPTAELDACVAVLRIHVPGAQLRKTGSRAKGVAIEGSDFDYPPEEMTTLERDLIFGFLQKHGYDVSCNKAFTLKTVEGGASIDFFPQKAEWHENVPVQKPGSLKFDPGARNATRKLKDKARGLKDEINIWLELLVISHRLEEIIQREYGLKGKKDPSGLRRYEVACHRILMVVHDYCDDDDDDYYYYYFDDDDYHDDDDWILGSLR